ncbi:hypothetical protein HanRHA438_Chr15g0714361 [Helianthus annuus]|uniref:Uncharacterized protein n=1 Tax=Helianthus annuus TaxID=4232 RepID=A0A9K3E3B0_HELAN|nr:hypothetical protein HanXRQr2_Chr15g0702051 [Helianthus annuus]KAJ0451838.1 hypothetical protein HanHA300_Chr15g0572111 [Helianthus annuus]KAJ0456536.1 hypothetical protein HanIR_Chr15g0763531 [Helianthus annuus]KAJ0473725.1 hypothetical protein HanHA89_Chr15g0621611 [Helianthus annuus]KAJ0649301.1 hypothetical protein HanLR1_Chr15g0582701 [Helianthus annuus]
MATPSKPSSPPPTQPTPPSSPVAEEEADEDLAGKFLSVLKWKYTDFRTLMTTVQMRIWPASFYRFYLQDGDTTADAPVGMVTMFTDFFSTCNLRLLLTFLWWTCWNTKRFIFPSLVRWGWYVLTFRVLFLFQNIEPLVEDFRRFYQLHVQLGFYSFYLRKNAPKIMLVPPKGFTAWKTKFFYVKEAAVTCKLHFINVTRDIAKEKISLPRWENKTGLILCNLSP